VSNKKLYLLLNQSLKQIIVMKRKIFTIALVVGGFALTSCQEDPTMEELIQDTELISDVEATTGGNGSGNDGSQGTGDGGVGGNN